MKFHLDNNIIEGTPEELVEYLRLVEGNSSDNQLLCFGHAHQPDEDTLKSLLGSLKGDDSYTDSTEISTKEEDVEVEPPTELQVGDKVKVLDSACGAVGEATVTAVLGDGYVEIAGKDKDGDYLTNWSSHELLLEKIEEEEEDELLGYRFWYLENINLNSFYVLKATTNYFEDSKGKRYTYQDVSGYVKPLDRDDARKRFKRAKENDKLLRYYPKVDLFTHEKLQ